MPVRQGTIMVQLLVCILQTKATWAKPPWLSPIQTCRQQEQLLATYGNIHRAGQQQRQPAAAAAAAGPIGPAAEQQQQQQDALDDSLAQHFASIQELSDRQALEELLPRLQQVVGQVGNVSIDHIHVSFLARGGNHRGGGAGGHSQELER
jgi:hypothetical protein